MKYIKNLKINFNEDNWIINDDDQFRNRLRPYKIKIYDDFITFLKNNNVYDEFFKNINDDFFNIFTSLLWIDFFIGINNIKNYDKPYWYELDKKWKKLYIKKMKN